ncbi:MAG: hypothetical protein BroJett013_22800 [Alphaproteobacteria bacterium]|nr:MAG: hypothetical protein BroJett013_22800 [Alphaproteobacteria bacterium]
MEEFAGVTSLATDTLAGHKSFNAYNINYVFPLYLYPQREGDMFEGAERASNLKPELMQVFAEQCGLRFCNGVVDPDTEFGPVDVFDYIYAVLHSTSYLDTFAEFLRINFPRIPYPRGGEQFRRIAALGSEMRAVHFLRHPNVQLVTTRFPVPGRAVVQRPRFSEGRVLINETQYFDGVSESAWSFPVGGFQPAQKWLKDREGRALTLDELRHWQKIVAAIGETERVVREINETIGL